MQSTATERRWLQLISEQERSGLSIREFAVTRGVSPWSMYTWRSKLGRTRRRESRRPRPEHEGSPLPAGLVAVEIVDAAESAVAPRPHGFEVQLDSGARVLVPQGFDADDLARLLSVLRSSC